LEVALDDEHAERLRRSLVIDALPSSSAQWLDAAALAELEPALSHASGAVLHAEDGSADNVALLAALRDAVASSPRIEVVRTAARSVEMRATTHPTTVAVSDSTGTRHEAPIVVLAAGAWVNQLAGLPRWLHVEPVRGQMIAYETVPVRHVTCGPNGYLVPRASGETLAGATMEREGFDVRTTDAARQSLQRSAERLCPALERRTVLRQWAGLRPVTPDFQPIIGADPDHPGLLYACGHSRNGVLMAPLTGDCIAALATGAPSPFDLSSFSISRFDGAPDSAISRR
jgi:glycine oxidase